VSFLDLKSIKAQPFLKKYFFALCEKSVGMPRLCLCRKKGGKISRLGTFKNANFTFAQKILPPESYFKKTGLTILTFEINAIIQIV